MKKALLSASLLPGFMLMPVQAANTEGWERVESANDLVAWEGAWNEGGSPSGQLQFPHTILGRDDVTFFGRKGSNGFDAGVIANISKDCVGLSNCFGKGAFSAAASLCAELSHGKLPVVGYERGNDLTIALDVGFCASGNLRVWKR